MKRLAFILFAGLFAVLIAGATGAYAQNKGCSYNGKPYDHGDRVGPYTCVNGRWR